MDHLNLDGWHFHFNPCAEQKKKNPSQALPPSKNPVLWFWRMKCIAIHTQSNDCSQRNKSYARRIFGTHIRMILLVTALPHSVYFPKPPALSGVGIQCWIVLSTVPRSSHSSKSVDDLMQDEKRQQSFFFHHTTWDLFPLNINNTLEH